MVKWTKVNAVMTNTKLTLIGSHFYLFYSNSSLYYHSNARKADYDDFLIIIMYREWCTHNNTIAWIQFISGCNLRITNPLWGSWNTPNINQLLMSYIKKLPLYNPDLKIPSSIKEKYSNNPIQSYGEIDTGNGQICQKSTITLYRNILNLLQMFWDSTLQSITKKDETSPKYSIKSSAFYIYIKISMVNKWARVIHQEEKEDCPKKYHVKLQETC